MKAAIAILHRKLTYVSTLCDMGGRVILFAFSWNDLQWAFRTFAHENCEHIILSAVQHYW